MRTLRILALCTSLLIFSSCAQKEPPELVVYTYDSFVAEWGAAPRLAPLFEKSAGIKLSFVSKGDGGQLLSAIQLEKGAPRADVALGLDNHLASRALKEDLFEPYHPKGLDGIAPELRLDPSGRLNPFDYGHFALIWDSAKLQEPPASLEDLAKPQYAKKLILMDPRTSTPGLGFLAWTMSAYGKDWESYWERLRPSVLVMTPGWDTGYGLFTAGEAPLVISYATSPAYHAEYDEAKGRYKALEFKEGHSVQIELAGIVKGARHRRNAERFMDFLLSEEAQRELPLTQWMYPARAGLALPESFRAALRPAATLATPPEADLTEASRRAAEILSGK